MAKNDFTSRLLVLETEIENVFSCMAQTKGKESMHSGTPVIRIKRDDLQFNLEGGRYLTEISATRLIDNSGYEYFFSVLNTSQLCELADYVANVK